MMSIIYATVSGRDALSAIAVSAAVFCRENLLALIVFNILHCFRCGPPRRYVRTAVLHCVPILVFILSRIFPVFLPLTPDPGLTPFLNFGWNFASMPGRQGVVAMGYLNARGLVLMLALYRGKHVAKFLTTHYEWLFYVVASLAMSIVVGVDVDRFALWLAPALIVASLDPEPAVEAGTVRLWAYLLFVHAASMELFLPWYPDRAFSDALCAPYARGEAYAAMTIGAAALCTGLAVGLRATRPIAAAPG
jgi:hypothetical protein